MPDLGWGAGGYQAYQEDTRQNELVRLQQIAMGIESEKADREAREAELEANAAERINRIIAGNPEASPSGIGDSDGDIAAAIEEGARAFLEGGSTARGLELLASAQDYRKGEFDIQNADADARAAAAKAQMEQANAVYLATQHVTNDEEWDAAISGMEASGTLRPEEAEALRQFDGSPEVVEYFRQQAMSAKDQADLAYRAADDERAERSLAYTERHRANVLAQANARAEDYRQRTEIMAKNGGQAGYGAPTDQELETVDAAIEANVFNGRRYDDLEGVEQIAYNSGRQAIAARAKELIRGNQALDFNTAVSQALTESRAAGDWPDMEFEGEEVVGYADRRGRTADVALPLPIDKDPSKLVVGRYYMMPNGTPAKWDGRQFVGD